MSTDKRLLERPAVIAAVAAGLAAVVLLNVLTFGGETRAYYRQREAAGDVLDEELRPVAYLLENVEDGATAAPRTAAAGRFVWPRQARDPFGGAAAGEDPALPDPEGRRWRCDAVVLRGPDPVALINGTPYRLGERVGELTVAAIDREGVTLGEGDETLRLGIRAVADQVTVLAGPVPAEAETTPGHDGRGDHGGKR